jgi:hypothetical protein
MDYDEDEEEEDTWEYEPWADPAIQQDYQAALGEFLVKFNRLENLIGDLILHSLTKLGRPDLYRPEAQLSSKLHTLELVGLALPNMHKPTMKAIRDLLGERNTLAHGHFDQNPYSGEYSIKHGAKSASMPLTKIRTLCELAEEAMSDINSALASHWFDGVVLIDVHAG